MDIVKEIVANLAVLVLVSVFLELLLPQSSLRGFVRLVMGLLLLLAVLSPLAKLADIRMPLRGDLSLEAADTPSLLARGADLNLQLTSWAFEDYNDELAQQTAVLLEMAADLAAVEVKFIFDEQMTKTEGVKVMARLKQGQEAMEAEKKQRISDMIYQYLNINKEKIEITFVGEAW